MDYKKELIPNAKVEPIQSHDNGLPGTYIEEVFYPLGLLPGYAAY